MGWTNGNVLEFYRDGGWFMWLSHLCFLIGSSKLGSCLSAETGSMGPVFFMITFQKDDILRSWKINISWGTGRIFSDKFSKVNAVRKGKSGDCSQEETYLKFIQVEENVSAFLVNTRHSFSYSHILQYLCIFNLVIYFHQTN